MHGTCTKWVAFPYTSICAHKYNCFDSLFILYIELIRVSYHVMRGSHGGHSLFYL